MAANKTAASKKLIAPSMTSRELLYRPTLAGWTPDKTVMAQDQADGGGMMLLADLVETIFRDDRVTGVLSTRTHGLLGLPVDFFGGTEESRTLLRGTEEGVPGEWWKMHPESEIGKLQNWGLMLGVGLAQRIELPRVFGGNHRYRIKAWSPRWLTYYHQPVNGAHWSVITQDGTKYIAPGDGEWIVYTPYGASRPWAEGYWRTIVFPWLLKHYSLEDRANYSEALGNPLWVGNVAAGSTEKQRKAFLSQLRSVGKAGKFVLPPGWDLELKEATGKSFEIYEGQVKWADEAITIALAGQLVTTEGMTGFSDGNVHDNIKQDLIRLDGERLSSCLRDQSLEQWALANFEARDAAPWPRWHTQRPDDVDAETKALSQLGDAISKLTLALVPFGMQPDISKIVAEFGLPVQKIAETQGTPLPASRRKKK